MKKWDIVIKPKKSWTDFNILEIFNYKDLILLLVKRDFTTFYKQTILGPLWYIIQPLVNTIVFTVIFGNLASISTNGTPPFIFYMAGTVAWGYFSVCLNNTSNTFVTNANLFGKVYFPRIVVPISIVLVSIFQFIIQFIIFISFYFYFVSRGMDSYLDIKILILPLLILQMAFVGLGFGLLISALTSKYRDLTFAMTFLVQIWMFATPVVYPFSIIPERYKVLASLNPMTSIIESFKHIFFNNSAIEFKHIMFGLIISVIVFIIGFLLFSRVEKDFMDTV